MTDLGVLSVAIERTSLSREAYRVLRSAILSRALTPGSKLSVRPLSEALGLSPTPVKEALYALEREGLVAAVPNRGYFVPRFGAADVPEIYELREALEGQSAGLAARRAGPALGATLRQLLDDQRACDDVERYGDLDLDFHRTLWEASGNRRLARMAETIAGQLRLLISTSALVPGRVEASLDEHEAIVEAIERGRPAAAATAMRRHVQRAGRTVAEHFKRMEAP